MNLTAYSDSESDGETPPAPKPAAKPASKPSFQKVVDRSNPGRIKVNLPGASRSQAEKDDIQDDAPPAKKPRLGGGGFGGFNAMLPAPKKPNASVATATAGATAGKKALGKGLGAGVSLKTGAEPAFKREPRAEAEEYDEQGNPVKKEPMKKEDFRAMLNLPSKTEPKTEPKPASATEEPKTEPQIVSKPAAARFVPMSVGKGKKKKPVVARPAVTSAEGAAATAAPVAASQSSAVDAKPARKPKISLFGVSQDEDKPVKGPSDDQYQPLLYGAEDADDAPVPDEAFAMQSTPQNPHHAPAPVNAAAAAAPHDLTNLASELNLSSAERRQLLGKQGRSGAPDISSARIVEFNTDTEYAHNEKMRQLGDQVQHNPLKSISGTGKNSLRSLVSAATTQKDALEDHFAASHRNKREAGSKYGW
ncbi:Nn.00g039480.m01.CDS01 [Neocucurbitaria sp. VM-36]